MREVNPLHVFSGHRGPINNVACSADSQVLLSASDDRTVRLWDIEQMTPGTIFHGHEWLVLKTSFAPHDDQFWSISLDRMCILWDRPTQQPLEKTLLQGESQRLLAAAFGPEDQLVLGATGHYLSLWTLPDGELVQCFNSHPTIVSQIALSPSRKLALSANCEGMVRVFNIKQGTEQCSFTSGDGAILALAISPDDRLALVGGSGTIRHADHSIHLWDLKEAQEIGRLEGHTAAVTTVAFSPDGMYCVSGSEDRTVRLWHVKDRRQLAVGIGHIKDVKHVSFTPDQRFVVSASNDKTVRLYQML